MVAPLDVLASKSLHPDFNVADGTVKHPDVAPLYKLPVAVAAAVVHPFALNVTVTDFFHNA